MRKNKTHNKMFVLDFKHYNEIIDLSEIHEVYTIANTDDKYCAIIIYYKNQVEYKIKYLFTNFNISPKKLYEQMIIDYNHLMNAYYKYHNIKPLKISAYNLKKD